MEVVVVVVGSCVVDFVVADASFFKAEFSRKGSCPCRRRSKVCFPDDASPRTCPFNLQIGKGADGWGGGRGRVRF